MKNCEICGRKGHTEEHHIESKSLGGSNRKSNIAFLCPNCHTDVHYGDIILEGRFRTTEGVKLIFHRKEEAPITDRELPNVFIY